MCQDMSREIQMLNKRQFFQSASEGKCKTERVKDCKIKSLKNKGIGKHKGQIVEKEHDLWMYQNEKEEAKRLHGVTWAPPRNLTKWPDWEEARKVGKWQVEAGTRRETGGARNLIVSGAVEGTPVDLDGESRHEQVEAKLSRRGREMLNEDEESRSPKRKVFRVQSEETQDYVKEGRSTEQEEEEKEDTFEPSAVSVPLKPCFVVTDNAPKKPQLLAAGVGSGE